MTAKRCLGEADAICAPCATGRHYQERPPPETGDFKDGRFCTLPHRLLRLYQNDSVNLWTFEGPVTPRREPSVLHRLAKTLDDGAPPKPLRGGRQSAGPDSTGKAGFRLAALTLAIAAAQL